MQMSSVPYDVKTEFLNVVYISYVLQRVNLETMHSQVLNDMT
jgi:hypothetical protein